VHEDKIRSFAANDPFFTELLGDNAPENRQEYSETIVFPNDSVFERADRRLSGRNEFTPYYEEALPRCVDRAVPPQAHLK
jgi:hypothetical protein